MKSKEVEFELYLTYGETSEGGGICEGDEDRDWPNHEDEYKTVTWEYLYKKYPKKTYQVETVPVDFDPDSIKKAVYVLVVTYQTGDTFGCSHGNWEVIGIYKQETKANKLLKQIDNDTYPGYKPWKGYFEKLESVEVFTMKIE
jgi:hypothetical protein